MIVVLICRGWPIIVWPLLRNPSLSEGLQIPYKDFFSLFVEKGSKEGLLRDFHTFQNSDSRVTFFHTQRNQRGKWTGRNWQRKVA